MNHLFLKSGVAVVALVVSVASWAQNPCMPIAQACMKEGYYKGGSNVGKGLIEDCVKPVIAKTKIIPNTAFSDDTLQQCAATIEQKSTSQ